jgi:hypothetical protein
MSIYSAIGGFYFVLITRNYQSNNQPNREIPPVKRSTLISICRPGIFLATHVPRSYYL